jgi:hypothetical protein
MQPTFGFTNNIGADRGRSDYAYTMSRPIYRTTLALAGEVNEVIPDQPRQIEIRSILETGTFATA